MKDLEKNLMIGAAIGGVLFLAYVASRGVKGTAQDIAGGIVTGVIDAGYGAILGAYNALPEAIQPSSDKNIIYGGVNSVGGAITGQKDFRLGEWIYDVTH